jgi:glutathione S-transferase
MLTLYHAPQSRSSRIVWLLEELGAPYELRITDIPRPDGSGAPDPGNPHPDRKVPALVDDGVLVTESAAIVLYLTDRFPSAGIGPVVDDALRGRYLTWLAYYAGVLEPVVTFEFAQLANHPALQRTLRAGPYVLGERFSGADVLVASLGLFARNMLPAEELVDAYLASIAARPALARAQAKDRG